MPASPDVLPEVYSPAEIARAAGVESRDVERWVRARRVRSLRGGFFSTRQAVLIVRHLAARGALPERRLFEPAARVGRRSAMPLAATAALHAGLLAAIVLLSTGAARSRPVANVARQVRLVFLAAPGPGGGGGGGGTQAPIPASAALGRGAEPLRSPVPIRRPPVVRMPKVVRAVERPPVQVEPLPPVTAPVVPVAADARERAGIPVEPAPAPESQGTGTNAGAGTGKDGGLGAGTGAGIGPGSGGGTGGGPYRPGAGITPPALLVEVKPDYTEQARRQNIEGNVELEIVVRSDGRVGDVTLLHGLGAGLDQRAVDAVRQWRFSPARRSGAPVDVIVQVAVEFALR